MCPQSTVRGPRRDGCRPLLTRLVLTNSRAYRNIFMLKVLTSRGSNRSERGAQTHAVLANALRTIQQRHVDAGAVFSGLLRSPDPTRGARAADRVISTTH